ncbi:hypothetical protein [Winogradskyella damuponensis]|uniref:Uncharacterized protein n=1 Tax=Winogradskyella damuponensis TaxID=943939 RepID=A0ABP8CQI5_9FLAO
MKIDYLNIIKSAFENHEISKAYSIDINYFERSENYPNSEGIHFESKLFCGEIFMYFGTMKYLEAQFVIFETGSDNTIIKDDLDKSGIVNEIIQFLDARTVELKTIA